MAAFPSYVRISFDGMSEDFDPSVLVTEMERGGPKYRVQNSQVLMKISCNLIYLSNADIASFEAWYFDTIKRIGKFDLVHPRTGVTVSANFEGGKLGPLQPLAPAFGMATRSVVFEYLR